MYSSSKSKTSSSLAFLKGFTDEMMKIANLTDANKRVRNSGPAAAVGGTSLHKVRHYSKPATMTNIVKTAPTLAPPAPPAVQTATTTSPPAVIGG
jgi:hypothetical protein